MTAEGFAYPKAFKSAEESIRTEFRWENVLEVPMIELAMRPVQAFVLLAPA